MEVLEEDSKSGWLKLKYKGKVGNVLSAYVVVRTEQGTGGRWGVGMWGWGCLGVDWVWRRRVDA
jgi:hypothetical protein